MLLAPLLLLYIISIYLSARIRELWIIAFFGITIILMGLGNKASKKTSVQKSELKAQRQQEYVEKQIKRREAEMKRDIENKKIQLEKDRM